VVALEDISLEIHSGEFVGVIGPNGSGKTTLCRAVLGLMPVMSYAVTTGPRLATCLRREWSTGTFPSRFWKPS
jgi:ABC-type Mn2+/Zn2+ transport system ATPase subunit